MDHFVKVLRDNPNDAASSRNLAALLMAEGRVDQALKHYEVAIQADPRNPAIRFAPYAFLCYKSVMSTDI